jgi:hypothetical protein
MRTLSDAACFFNHIRIPWYVAKLENAVFESKLIFVNQSRIPGLMVYKNDKAE